MAAEVLSLSHSSQKRNISDELVDCYAQCWTRVRRIIDIQICIAYSLFQKSLLLMPFPNKK